MSWIDIGVITVIVIIGLFIMYRALKEPIDALLGLLGKGFGAIRDKIADMREGSYGYEEIRYG